MPASPQRRTRRVTPAETPEQAVAEAPAANPARTRKPATQLRRVQAATADPKVRLPEGKRAEEAADGVLVAPIDGRAFRIEGSIGLMPLMEWAAARADTDTSNGAELLALYRILKSIVHEDDWNAFCEYTRDRKCGDEEFAAFQNAAMEAIAARPTRAPATS